MSVPTDWTRVNQCDKQNMGSGVCGCGSCRIPTKEDVSIAPHTTFEASGKVVFCLPDYDSEWFQGHLITAQKNYGLLVRDDSDELDKCVQCAEGGYRQVSISIASQNIDIHKILWTGGDLMEFHHPCLKLEVETTCMGKQAAPLAERYFGGLLQHLRTVEGDPSLTALELMPSLAIVTGELTIAIREIKN